MRLGMRNLFITLSLFSISFYVQAEGPVKVFLMAGQSNMGGYGRPDNGRLGDYGALGSLRYKVNQDPANYGHLVDSQGDWVKRDDVWVWSTTDDGESGQLDVGFGFDDRFGPELGFGHVVGDYFDEPVLLIKVARGGRSLGEHYRSPSAVNKRGGSVGEYYDLIVGLHAVLTAQFDTQFPELAGRETELAGFVWHQGWHDRINPEFTAEYEDNLVDFISDIRHDLDAPNLPFVIAESGMGGHAETDPDALALMEAQAAAADPAQYPQHEGNVGFVETKGFYRVKDTSPIDQVFHWNHNGESLYLIGEGLGEEYLTLVPEPGSLAMVAALGLWATTRRRRSAI